ncbi:MAG: FtsX-like permease family protein [Pseudomonadota bacterium]
MVLLSLSAILTPFLTAMSISEGLKKESRAVLESGADLYITQDQFGSNAPIPLSTIQGLATLPGVKEVIPRVIGRTYLDNTFLAVLGISPDHLPPALSISQGRGYRQPGEVLIGEGLAVQARIKPGQKFFLSRHPAQIFEVVGLFRSTYTIWNSDLLIMSLDDAAQLFQLPGKATDLVLKTLPGYEDPLAEKILLMSEAQPGWSAPLRVQTKTLVKSYILRGFDIKAGVFSGIYSLAFLLAIPILLVSTGLGLAARKREIGIIKALGWQTQEVLILMGLENAFLAFLSIPFILLLSQLWLKIFNGYFINRFFVANWEILPPFSIPAESFPIPFLLTFFLVLILTLVGSLYSTWRMAIAPPHEAMHG